MHFKHHPIKINCIKLSCREHTIIFYVDNDYKKQKKRKTFYVPMELFCLNYKIYPDIIICGLVSEAILLICDDSIC